jgi:hypothetical protein
MNALQDNDVGADEEPGGRTRFQVTLIRVMSMQVIALVLLWLLQARYAS